MTLLKQGAKRAVTVAPLPRIEARTKAARAVKWIPRYVQVPKGHGAGKSFELRPWQRQLVRGFFGEGIRQGLISLPRGNGKTSLAAAVALFEMFDNPHSPQVIVVAADQRQAQITLNIARRMIECSPELEARARIYTDKIVVPETGGEFVALPSDSRALQGWDPSLAIVDELHVVDADCWEAVLLASGKRPESLTLAISTPSNSHSSVMWGLVEHGRKADDPSFFFREYAAPPGCRTDDRKAWQVANPALGDFLAEDALRATQRTTRESSFRRYRLGQWVEHDSAWLDADRWTFRTDKKRQVRREPVVLAFDGSASGDSTALVGCTINEPHHIFTVAVWEKPKNAPEGWRVPRDEVHRTVESAMSRYNVRELTCDVFEWRSDIERWARKFGERKVSEFPCNSWARMAPAVDRFTQAVFENEMTHDGNKRMTEHVGNCRIKSTPSGDVVVKDSRNSPRKIDLAVAGCMALHRAAHHAQKKPGRLIAV